MKLDEAKKSVIEFFLGKNVIAKIAVFLLFLGVVSFGQLAYVEWLNDIARNIFIVLLGILIFALGYYFERKENVVFNNVFYILGTSIIYLSLWLGMYEFEHISNEVFLILKLLLLIGTFIYFYVRRYDFLDSFLLVLYLVAGLHGTTSINDQLTSFESVELCIRYVLLGGILLRHFGHNITERKYLTVIHYAFVVVYMAVLLVNHLIHITSQTSTLTVFVLAMFTLFTTYLVNLYILHRSSKSFMITTSIVSPILLIISSVYLVIAIYGTYGDFAEYFVLFFLLSLLPLFVFVYNIGGIYRKTIGNIFLSYLIFSMLIYTSIAFQGSGHTRDFYRLFVLMSSVITCFISYKILDQESFRYGAAVLAIVAMYRVFGITINDGINLQDINYHYLMAISGLVVTGILVFFRHYIKRFNQVDDYVVHSYNILFMIPIVFILVDEYITSTLFMILGFIALSIVVYRWVLQLKVFNQSHIEALKTALNVKYILLVCMIGFIYFDHDFTKISHVLYFLFILALNVYVIYALKEVYDKVLLKGETMFVIFYVVGVFIHSFFIHNYINIEFDKVILSSYFMIASAVGVLIGFRNEWTVSRRVALGCIYYSLLKFFIYDFYVMNFETLFRMITYFILGLILLGISFLYSYLEKTYGTTELIEG